MLLELLDACDHGHIEGSRICGPIEVILEYIQLLKKEGCMYI